MATVAEIKKMIHLELKNLFLMFNVFFLPGL